MEVRKETAQTVAIVDQPSQTGSSTTGAPLHLSAALPLDRDGGNLPGPGWFVVVAVLMILLVSIFLMRKGRAGKPRGFFQRVTRERSIRLVESRAIGRRGALHVVEYGQRRILLAESDAGIEKILDEPLPEQAGG